MVPNVKYWPHEMPAREYQTTLGYLLKSVGIDYDEEILRLRIYLHNGDAFSDMDYNLLLKGSWNFFVLQVHPPKGECALELYHGKK